MPDFDRLYESGDEVAVNFVLMLTGPDISALRAVKAYQVSQLSPYASPSAFRDAIFRACKRQGISLHDYLDWLLYAEHEDDTDFLRYLGQVVERMFKEAIDAS